MKAQSLALLCLAAVTVALAWPAGAGAVSVAYVDDGEVWVAALDGTQKARVAGPVVNGEGVTERWLDVAQSDGGRIVAVRNDPAKDPRSASFKVWEPDGTSTVQGPLNAPGGYDTYFYPQGFDITADGGHLVYGFSNTTACCPVDTFAGTYVRPVSDSVLAPTTIPDHTHPSTFGQRIIGASGSIVAVQDGADPYGMGFTDWQDVSTTGLGVHGTDVAASGTLSASEGVEFSGGVQTVGRIGVLTISGVDVPPPFPAAVSCFVPAAGMAKEVSLSPDATRIAWSDDTGLNVAGTPTTAADPCELTAPPVVISATGHHGSIGGGSVTPFLPQDPEPTPTPTPDTPAATATPATSTTPTPEATPEIVAAPELSLPARLKAKRLAAKKGLRLTVRVGAPGPVSITVTRTGKPVVLGTGTTTTATAGDVAVKLRVKRALRRKVRGLGGKRVTFRVAHAGHTIERTVRLR